jgi:hypothetical protein
MKRMIYIMWLVCWADPLWAQVHGYAGGAIRSAPRIRSGKGPLSLLTMRDREYAVGFSKPWKSGSRHEWGCLSTILFRSPFYELRAAIPYYPLKAPIPTYRIESIQVNPFFSFVSPATGSRRWKGWVRGGPVFAFHAVQVSSTTTARTVPGQNPFVLYRLTIRRQSIGIPYARVQAGFSYRIWRRPKTDWMLHPFVQAEFGDRSAIDYHILPNDPMYESIGRMRNGNWSFGILCGLGKKR